MSPDSQAVRGSCACGAVTFTSTVAPTRVGYCHCHVCRKISGTSFGIWGYFPDATMSWSSKDVKTVNLTDIASRGFCQSCGSSLWITYHCNQTGDEPGTYVAMGMLDEDRSTAKLPKPGDHYFVSQKVSWYEILDGLDQFENFNPEFQETLDNWRATQKQEAQ